MSPIIVIGGGGFGRETLDVIEAINAVEPRWDVLGVVDDCPSEETVQRLAARGIEHLGSLDALASRPGCDVAIGIGAPRVRRSVAAKLARAGHHAPALVHPSATIGSVTRLADGVIVCSGARISTNVELGQHVHVNPGAIIGHDAEVDAFVSVNPGAVVSGDVRIGQGVLVGAGAVVLQGRRIGDSAVIGASACVTRDVGPRSTVVGIPARDKIGSES